MNPGMSSEVDGPPEAGHGGSCTQAFWGGISGVSEAGQGRGRSQAKR